MASIVHDGIRLTYEDCGAGEPAFVLVHGWACDSSFFAPQAEYLARRYRVVSLDLRGHGASDKPAGPYPIAAYADDIAYLAAELGLGKAVAIGHSMGGLIVLQLAAAHPDRVAAIIMVDPPPLVLPPERRAALEAMAAAIEAGNHVPRREFVESMFLQRSDRRLAEKVMAVMLAAPDEVAVSAMRGVLDFDGRAAIALCRAPALLLAAAPGRNPPHLLSELLPNCIYGCTVGAGHFNQLEVPDQVNAMIESFLRHYA